ncbi:MAG TPA: flagellar hook-associated protein FlgK [Steroidobacteraceae bacterium]|jgi:flagellar hook-associated protein 1 FlgK|nr:flagellar hook-associated protein FlgK [Steroidobacteraceae bacterium]
MADLLGTGLSSLRAMQRALDTTAHNIANVSTEGYTRQRVEFATRAPQASGANWIGSGVDAVAVRRVYDQFLSQQARSSSGTLARLDTYAAQAERLDNLLGDSSNGLGASLQGFTDAINEVSSTPSSISARQVLLAEGNALTERLKSYDTRLRAMSADVDSQLAGQTGEINTLAQGIARLNGDISVAFQQTGQAPNDLLDQRDRLIDQLSAKVGVSVVAEGDATLNVFIGTGQPLVLGTTASQITTAKDPLDAERLQLALKTPAGTVDISKSVSGGELGGLLDWRKQMLDPARNELGRITLAVSAQVNAVHSKGMDLGGALGGNFFNVGAVGVVPATTNTSGAVATATRVNLGALTANDYVVTRTTTGYTVRRQDTGASVTFTGSGTNADPLLFDGMAVEVGATAAAGDQFVIHPTRDAIQGFSVAITDPAKIAAAAPLRTTAASGNTGSGTITQAQVLAPGATTLTPVDIVFTSATTYTVNGGAAQTYTAGSNIDVNGWRVQINGTPATGDTFAVRTNAGAVGDNRNAFALADAMKAGVIEGGTVSVAAAVERMTGNLGLQTRAAQMSRDAEAVINESDLAARDAISGVNLDEEAANMLRYQQAYQAAAQIISAANEMFDTLINAVRR